MEFVMRQVMNTNLWDDPVYQLWVVLHQARDASHKARERELAKYGISAVQTVVLFVISANGGKTSATTISNWALRELHTISSILSRMEKMGLITKEKDWTKNGELTVSLTEKGKQAYQKTTDISLINNILCCLSEEERSQLMQYLKKIRDKALPYLVEEKVTAYP
jgi:MarR family transcriptional regulator, organic hydroperoxide resistance regulator